MSQESTPPIIRHVEVGQVCCDPDWEAAYERFETPEEEIAKFLRRLRAFGLDRLNPQSSVVELFCGRGGGLVALEQLGFRNLEGFDLSESLLLQYAGPAQLHLADCRSIPLDDDSRDVVIIQGGLHHLPDLIADLDATLSEVARILKPSARIYVVEPWMTPFLRAAHAITNQTLVRKIYAKGDALAAMTEHEFETYYQWLGMPDEVIAVFERHFKTVSEKRAWGKLAYIGEPLPSGTASLRNVAD